MNIRKLGLVVAIALILAVPLAAQQAPPAGGGNDHAAKIKQSLQASMKALQQYEWVETTVISVKGDEKSRTQKSCRYGADGKVEKTPMGAPPEDSGRKPRGIRGRVAEHKKAEITDSMKEAVGLIKQYVPPDPARIDAAKQAGKLSVVPPDANGLVKIVMKDYLKAGDSVTIDLNAAKNLLSGMAISTFTENKDVVGLKVSMGTFEDGTVYPANVHLDVKAENLAVAIENSGYNKVGG